MGFVIEIEVSDSGSITVSSEQGQDQDDAAQAPADPAAAAGAAPAAAPTDDESGEGDESQPQPAKDIGEALQIAEQMYEQLSGDTGSDEEDPANGSTPLTGGDAKAAWNQLAAKRDKMKMSQGM